jgi:cytochrome c biogenesis protein CcmG, thiol:disulfide interchange protein DsbE
VSRRTLSLTAIAAGVAAVVIVGAILARDTGPAPPVSSRVESEPLTVSGQDIVTGRQVTLAAFEGKPVVLTIWASWCPGCNAEASTLARFAEAHPEAGFFGVDFQDTKDAARSFYRRYGWRFPSVFDPEGRIADELGLQGTPTTIFLDVEHREITRIVGETDEAGLTKGLEQATARA